MDDQRTDRKGGGETKANSPTYRLGCLLSVTGGIILGAATLYGIDHLYDVKPLPENWYLEALYGGAGVTVAGLLCLLFGRR